MGSYIVVTSGKGGTGKTTCTGALASALALLGRKTLCIDCDVGLRNLDLVLGLTEPPVWDFSDVLSGDVEPAEAALPHPEIEGLYFLPAPSSMRPEDIELQEFLELKGRFKDEFDYVLADCPAGLGQGFRLASQGADMGLIVTTVDLPSLRDAQRTVQELSYLGICQCRLIINRVSPRALRMSGLTLDDAIDLVGARLVGVISEDDSVQLAANVEKPLMKMGAKYAYGQFMDIARRITGEKVPLPRRIRAD